MRKLTILLLFMLGGVLSARAQTDYWGGKSATQGYNFLETTFAANFPGGTSIITLGTVTTGVWNGTAIANANLANSSITIQGSAVSLGGTTLATNSTPQFLREGLGQAADATASLALVQTGLNATRTDGVLVQNTTAATSTHKQQFSPSLVYAGTADNTSSGDVSETDKIEVHLEPQTVAGTTTANYVWQASIAGGAYSQIADLTSGAVMNLASGGYLSINGTKVLDATSAPALTTASALVTVGALSSGSLASGFTVVTEALGGTHQSSYTTGDLLYASASNTLSKLGIGSGTQLLGISGGHPAWVAAPSGGLAVSAITADQSAVAGQAYVNNKSGSRCVVTLPTTGSVGDMFQLIGGSDASGWKVAQNASQTITWGGNTSTSGTGGYFQSLSQGDVVTIMCIAANNTWEVLYASEGTIN